ncbi:hypothetical protein FE257_004815 [Aspergillus nanangensis]|uniref:RNA-dependent RNA polymerase n=1 Tax=Aspergillus nanangensis TaxID=2582783 RepID=A0AAD4GVX5_ASPNN|nr:hypothetical protein FE257_004815 [Aspergillus nanangensis]
MAFPQTPERSGQQLQTLVDSLNDRFSLEIRNPQIFSPSTADRADIRWRTYQGIHRLYWNRNVDLNKVISDFEEWVERPNAPKFSIHTPATKREQLLDEGGGRQKIPPAERDARLRYLADLVRDELYMLNNGSFSSVGSVDDDDNDPSKKESSPSKRRKRAYSTDDEEFHTAPTSPVKDLHGGNVPAVEPPRNMGLGRGSFDGQSPYIFQNQPVASPAKPKSKFVERLTAPNNVRRYDAPASTSNNPEFSFISATNSSFNDTRRLDTSFTSTVTNITEPDLESTYGESAVEQMTEMMNPDLDEMLQPIKQYGMGQDAHSEQDYSAEGKIMHHLINHGPFTLEQSIPSSVAFRYRYELERIGRAWNISLDKMLVGKNISFKTHEGFWKWVEGHSQRDGKPLPPKSSGAAWEAAKGNFRTENHSEAVVLTGELDWCGPNEKGILKLKLNPLKTERTCRFRRRFGSDRFLSVTMPAPSRPPPHLRVHENPSLLRESLAQWLTQRVHRCLGRTWRAYYVTEVKTKNASKALEPMFRVEFFALYDGVDPERIALSPLAIAPVHEASESRTPMSLDALINWHMPLDHNAKQSNCKLFQRLSLGLSKTFATIVLKPYQVLHLKDIPGRPVMNDGCALMSRGLANQICDSLGITGSTPSCFQGRIAGAKGLWMVDRHDSDVSTKDIWIQISDSQLKIHPHPRYWTGPVDDEQLTFEVIKWSKPLHPVALNIQLLKILEHGGPVRGRIAQLTRSGIRALFEGYAEVLQKDSPELCRAFVQKIASVDESSSSPTQRARRMEEWMANDAEAVIRYCEAGFSPRSFAPLRKRLWNCLRNQLDRYVKELHIEVPLSTYAFCVADPYGVLKPDEVHFGFSSNWRDPQNQFQDNLLDAIDVLVGRLPAHRPSDVQRLKVVWKPELRHLQDVIVFPSTGDMPLAHMLSGGDYDGDTPWICWDRDIVQNFRNSSLPAEEFPPVHFGVENFSVPMADMSMDEFLESTFTFNLTLSNLGRCTVEHEKIAYDESIDSPSAIELTSLLSHLVDGRKAGDHLSEQAWQKYRKRISPMVRELPAYKNPDRRPKLTNIVDYLRFQVAREEQKAVLTDLESLFPSHNTSSDESLLQPWRAAQEEGKIDKCNGNGRLSNALITLTREIDEHRARWVKLISEQQGFSLAALESTERARALPPPPTENGDHALLHVWRSRPDHWNQVLASYTYQKYPDSSFTMHAFGETLCRIKTSTMAARPVTNQMLSCYRPNAKAVARLVATEGAAREDGEAYTEDYEGHEAIEAMLYGTQTVLLGGYYDPDDRMGME